MSRRASAVPSAPTVTDLSLARLRYDAGLTQEELAAELHISLRTLQRLEHGESRPRPGLGQRIARRFDVTASELFPEPHPRASA